MLLFLSSLLILPLIWSLPSPPPPGTVHPRYLSPDAIPVPLSLPDVMQSQYSPRRSMAESYSKAFSKRQSLKSYYGEGPGPAVAGGFGSGLGMGMGGLGPMKQSQSQSQPQSLGQGQGQAQGDGGGADENGDEAPAGTGSEGSEGSVGGETVVQVATQDLSTISHLIVASQTASLPLSANTLNPTSFGPAQPARVPTSVPDGAASTRVPGASQSASSASKHIRRSFLGSTGASLGHGFGWLSGWGCGLFIAATATYLL